MKVQNGIHINNFKGWGILIVDDTIDNLAVARIVLQFCGAEVHTASDGYEGLALLRTIRPRVILLDIRMPKMNGWEMFRAVRDNPDVAHIPIIALTAYAMESDKEQILRAGFNGYITKPFDIAKFGDEIERIVMQKPQQKIVQESATA